MYVCIYVICACVVWRLQKDTCTTLHKVKLNIEYCIRAQQKKDWLTARVSQQKKEKLGILLWSMISLRRLLAVRTFGCLLAKRERQSISSKIGSCLYDLVCFGMLFYMMKTGLEAIGVEEATATMLQLQYVAIVCARARCRFCSFVSTMCSLLSAILCL